MMQISDFRLGLVRTERFNLAGLGHKLLLGRYLRHEDLISVF